MRELLEGKADVGTFASQHFGPAKALLAAPALDIFALIFLDDEYSDHTEVKERTAGSLLTMLAGELPVNDELRSMAASLKSPHPYTGMYNRPVRAATAFAIGTGMIEQPPTLRDLQAGVDRCCQGVQPLAAQAVDPRQGDPARQTRAGRGAGGLDLGNQ